MTPDITTRLDADGLIRRHATAILHTRVADTDQREFTGIGVPWDEVIVHTFGAETFDRGSVDADGAILLYGHRDVIGTIPASTDTTTGYEITGRISDTVAGRDVWTLVRDGAITGISIGFEPRAWRYDDAGILHWTDVRAREFSLVAFPAYDGAAVDQTSLRNRKDTTMIPDAASPDTLVRADLDPINEALDSLQRNLALLTVGHHAPASVGDTRSAGQALLDIVRGEYPEYATMQARAYTGGTTADAIDKPGWVGDLTRIIDELNPLAELFASGTLPDTGMNIEYGELATNTLSVKEQAKEADALAFGKVTVTTKTAPVKTFGGYTTLSVQEIERSANAVNILDLHLRGMAAEAGKALNTYWRTKFTETLAGQKTAGNKVIVSDLADWKKWFAGSLDAVEKFMSLGLPLHGLIVDKATFLGLGTMTDTTGRPIMPTSGDGVNTAGTITVGLDGNLHSIPVRWAPGLAAKTAAFYTRDAIRSYPSAIARLQDQNVVSLTNDFSVYRYAAIAAEIPAGLIPVTEA